MSPRTLIPTPAQLHVRLAEVDAQLADLDQTLQKRLTHAQKAGALAHIAALTHRRNWYLARLRSARPIQPLGVHVGDDVTCTEAHP